MGRAAPPQRPGGGVGLGRWPRRFQPHCQAEIIQVHTLESTGGLNYAELDRDDPLREVAQSSAFLQSSLFTSIVAFGVAAMAMAVGLLFILIGLGMRDVSQHVVTPAGDRTVVTS